MPIRPEDTIRCSFCGRTQDQVRKMIAGAGNNNVDVYKRQAEQEAKLRQPIDEHVGKIQEKLDALRVDGTDKVVELLNDIDSLRKDHIYTQQEKDARMTQLKADLEKAKAVEAKNKEEVSKLVAEGEAYIKAHYDQEYFQPVAASCVEEKAAVSYTHLTTL